MEQQTRTATRNPGPYAASGDDALKASTAAPSKPVRRILFASQKGGVGKTATAVNVAASLSQQGMRVLVVDTDPIGSVAACFGVTIAPGHPGVYGVEQWDLSDLVLPDVAPNLDFLPYAEDGRSIDLNALHRSLAELGRRVAGLYDYVIVDSRPAVADMTRRLCQVVDEVIVVVQCHPMAYRTLGGILGQLRDARSDGAEARLLGLLLTMVDASDPRQVQLEGHIRRSLGQAMLPVSVPWDPTIGEGLMLDRPVVIFSPDSPSAAAYREVTEFVVNAVPQE